MIPAFRPLRSVEKRTASTALLVAGIGVLCAGVLARKLLNVYRDMSRLSKLTGRSGMAYYHRGGFLPKMDRNEAALILSIKESSSRDAIREAHRRVMGANHPDRGGSPFLAMKINEAKSVLESRQQ